MEPRFQVILLWRWTLLVEHYRAVLLVYAAPLLTCVCCPQRAPSHQPTGPTADAG